jgi:hypothetical protein
MSFTSKLEAPERVSRWVVWVFVALLGAAVVASIGSPGGVQSPGTTLTPGLVETNLAHGVDVLAGVVEAAWRETVREVTRVVIAVLEWRWWPLDIVFNWQDLNGGADVLHS